MTKTRGNGELFNDKLFVEGMIATNVDVLMAPLSLPPKHQKVNYIPNKMMATGDFGAIMGRYPF